MTCRVLVQSGICHTLLKTVIYKEQNVVLRLVGVGSPGSSHHRFAVLCFPDGTVWLCALSAPSVRGLS